MRRLLLLLALSLTVTCYAQAPAHAQSSANPPTTPSSRAAPPAAHGQMGANAQHPASTAENCGTPDTPKPCPPMPKVPLQTYPANRP